MYYDELCKTIQYKKRAVNHYQVMGHSDDLCLIGRGRSAAVFKIVGTKKVIKAFYPEYLQLAKLEARIYKRLEEHPLFPVCYASGDGYIILDYIEGVTLFDCLAKGIDIPSEMVEKIDYAFESLSFIGLVPADMHLKNIIVTTDNDVRIIDVVRYSSIQTDRRWKDFKQYYDQFYHRAYVPKQYPKWLLTLIGNFYKKVWEKKSG